LPPSAITCWGRDDCACPQRSRNRGGGISRQDAVYASPPQRSRPATAGVRQHRGRYHARDPETARRGPTLDDPLRPTPTPDADPTSGSSDDGAPPAAPTENAHSAGAQPHLPGADAPGLGEQIGATRDAAKRMVGAHVELAKAEFGDIADAIKRAAILIGVAIGAAIFAAMLVAIGTPLFLGEWLFGSIGWGILLGLLLMLAIAVASGVKALDTSRSWGIGRTFLLAALIGIVVGVVLGLDLTNRAWTAVGDAVAGNLDASYRPLVVAAASLAVVGGVLGLIGGAARAGVGAGIGGLVGGAIGGALIGVLTAIATGPRVGAAIGVGGGPLRLVGLMGTHN